MKLLRDKLYDQVERMVRQAGLDPVWAPINKSEPPLSLKDTKPRPEAITSTETSAHFLLVQPNGYFDVLFGVLFEWTTPVEFQISYYRGRFLKGGTELGKPKRSFLVLLREQAQAAKVFGLIEAAIGEVSILDRLASASEVTGDDAA